MIILQWQVGRMLKLLVVAITLAAAMVSGFQPRMSSVLRTGSGNVLSMKVFDWQRRDAFEKFMPADGKMIIW